MSRLADWVRRPRWTADEARFILVGLDPELTQHDGLWAPAWLPGGLRPSWLLRRGREDRFTLSMEISCALETTATFCNGDPRSPRQWLDRSLAAHYEPPWLPLIDYGAEPFDTLRSKLTKVGTAQSLGGKAKSRGEPAHKAKRELLQAWDAESSKTGFDVARFKQEMKKRYPPGQHQQCSQSSINTWVRELALERAGGPSPAWAVEMRAESKAVC